MLKALYKKYRSHMVAVAYSVLRDMPLAEDAVQNAFVSLSKNVQKAASLDDIMQYCYMTNVAKNAACDIVRKQKRDACCTCICELENVCDEHAEQEIGELCDETTYDAVVRIIRELDPLYRTVLYFHLVDGMSTDEIAEMTGRKKRTVESQIYRAKKMVIERLRKEHING